MHKKILIVESDTSLSRTLRNELEGKGFGVEETTDGKGSIELIRRQKPDLVLLAVDLSAGQNGYILCGKLKKDDELKNVPVVIVGNPDGFAQHRKLKTHADEYVAKPVDLAILIERVGGIIGLPEPEESAPEVVDESLSLSDLVDEEPVEVEAPAEESASEEIAVEDAARPGDPELDMLDAAFDDISTEPPAATEEEMPAVTAGDEPPELPDTTTEASAEDGLSAFDDVVDPIDGLDDDSANEKTMVMEAPPIPKAPPPPPPARAASTPPPPRASATPASSSADLAELRNLRAKVAELQAAVEDANSRQSDADGKIQELESELQNRTTDLETARASGGKNDKEFFSLREAASRKDKEILRLKNEINEKDKEIVELRDREMQLEQQQSEANGEMARRDAQIKTLTTRADQLAADRKKIDQQLLSAKEESRGATAKLGTLQGEFDQLNEQLGGANAEVEELRNRTGDLESQVSQAQDEAAELRRELDALRASTESAREEQESLRGQHEQAQLELDAARNELSSLATSHEEETGGLRKRISELEESTSRHEERLTKLYQRIKGDEKMRDKTKKALSIALQLLEEPPAAPIDEEDEAAA